MAEPYPKAQNREKGKKEGREEFFAAETQRTERED
jgi:hypothetical protein